MLLQCHIAGCHRREKERERITICSQRPTEQHCRLFRFSLASCCCCCCTVHSFLWLFFTLYTTFPLYYRRCRRSVAAIRSPTSLIGRSCCCCCISISFGDQLCFSSATLRVTHSARQSDRQTVDNAVWSLLLLLLQQTNANLFLTPLNSTLLLCIASHSVSLLQPAAAENKRHVCLSFSRGFSLSKFSSNSNFSLNSHSSSSASFSSMTSSSSSFTVT